jgi:hypothetical protein
MQKRCKKHVTGYRRKNKRGIVWVNENWCELLALIECNEFQTGLLAFVAERGLQWH